MPKYLYYCAHIFSPKVKMHRPSVAASMARTLGNVRKISVGPLDGRGEDLPSGKNLADDSDSRGRMNLLRFYRDQREHFPTLWIAAQCEEPTKVVEVGCERFLTFTDVYHQRSKLDWE